MLAIESELAELYLRKESFGGETARLETERDNIPQPAASRHQRITTAPRPSPPASRRNFTRSELDAGTLRHERVTLEDRLREDYGIELAEQTDGTTIEAEHERAAIEEEINELRRKLSNIGGVNVDSLQEADELEAAFCATCRVSTRT